MADTHFTYTPTWKKHEKTMSSSDLDTALKGADAYQEEKAKELKTSKKARDWEKSKVKHFQKQKPQWVKDRQTAKEAPLRQMVQELKVGGTFDTGIQPMPGFVLIKPEFKETTDGGIVLVDSDAAKMQTNIGTVLAVGDRRVDLYEAVNPPVGKGQRVMFKKGLPGLEITIKGELCLLMQWDDILGVVL